ncbi:MAG: TIM barrel protein [Coriobacteriia bacterium]|nr:TIM barrel protein [Coriobacteriia bacterium]
MAAKYSLVHMTDPTCPPDLLIYIAAEIGYDCVGLRTIPTRLAGDAASGGMAAMKATTSGIEAFDVAHDPGMLRAIKRAAAETGVVINDTENARIFDGCDVRIYERDLEVAAELGLHHVLTNIWTDDKPFRLEQFCLLAELAAGYELTVNVEFVTWAGVKNLQDAKELLLASGADNVGIVVDALHCHRSRVDFSEFEGLPQTWFNYMHLSDIEREIPEDRETLLYNGRDERLYVGDGAIDLRALVSKMPNAVRGLEVPSVSKVKAIGAVAHARASLRKAKAYFGD